MSTSTLSDLVFRVRERAAGRANLLSVRLGERREQLSTSDFVANVHSLALALEELGVGKGDRVAIFSENRPEWPSVDFACQLLGAPTVPIYAHLGAQQVGYVLRNSGSRLVFLSDVAKRDVLRELESALPEPVRTVAFDAAAAEEGGLTLTTLLGRGAARRGETPLERLRERVTEDDLASLIYTSGTTGDPKGVMLTHKNLVSNFLALADLFHVGPEDLAVSFLPLSHVFQRTVDHLCLYRGASIHYVPTFDDVMPAVREVAPTLLTSVPRLYERACARTLAEIERSALPSRLLSRWALQVGRRHVAERRDGFVGPLLAFQRLLAEHLVFRRLRGRFGGRLRIAISGGAPLASAVAEHYEAIGMPLSQGYGLTESSPILATNTPQKRRPGSVGRAVPQVEVRLADDGEILVRGPGVMRGYWESPEATRQAVDDDGWLHTGDVGAMDKSGYIFIADRKRDLVTTADGKSLAPQPIESLLASYELISQAVVVGDGRPFPAVLVVPDFRALAEALGKDPDSEPAELAEDPEARRRIAAILTEVNGKLGPDERLRRFKLLPRALTAEAGEVTPTFRVRRRVVHQRFAEEIEALYAKAKKDDA